MTNQSRSIEYFKKEAKRLFRQVDANDAEALARVRRVLKNQDDLGLMRIQHVIAVEYGFLKWEELIQASPVKLQHAIATRNAAGHASNLRVPKPSATALGNFYRGLGIRPTLPHFAALADRFDKMTMEEQRRYLDEDARAMGFFNCP